MKEVCYNCDKHYEWVEVASGWDEDYCTDCNEKLSVFECRNCREEVEIPDTFCCKDCSVEYYE
tara:strand:+ start:329 stop:517 length:189 start_codon:yes stop_codon:yes gene_type:complete